MRALVSSALFAVLAIILVLPAAAQDATPALLGAENCTVDPIDPDAYNQAIQNSVPPFQASPNPHGTPADDATVAAVTDVIKQSVACTNIGDLGRLLAVIDPAYAPILLGVPYKDVPSAVEAAAKTSHATGPATPLVDDIDQGGLISSLLDVHDVQILPDGRVSAIAIVQRQGFPPSTVTMYFRKDDTTGHYIITDYVFQEIPVATPAA